MNVAQTAAELREAMRPWHVPTFNVVFADVDGHIGFQSSAVFRSAKCGNALSAGLDTEHQWQGLVPFEGMPQLADPERGWIATANNRVAPADFSLSSLRHLGAMACAPLAFVR